MKHKFPCREMFTRHCPFVYESVCGERPCARFESDDETPWLSELKKPCEGDMNAKRRTPQEESDAFFERMGIALGNLSDEAFVLVKAQIGSWAIQGLKQAIEATEEQRNSSERV